MLQKFVPLACLAALLCAACGRSDDDNDDSRRRRRRKRASRELDEEILKELPRPTGPSRYQGPAVRLDIKFKPGSYVQTESVATDGTMTIRAQGRSQDIDTGQDTLVEGDIEIHPPAPGSGERKIDYTCRRIKAKVEVVEPMGSETYLYLNTGIHSFISRVEPHRQCEVGDEMLLALLMSKAHIFDGDTAGGIV